MNDDDGVSGGGPPDPEATSGTRDTPAVPPPPVPPRGDMIMPIGTDVPPPVWPEPPAAAPEPPGRRRLTALVVAVIVVLALIAGILVLTLGGGGSPVTGSSASPTAGPTPPPLLAPFALTAEVDSVAVVLTWAEPPGGATVTNYVIHRDDTLLQTLPGTSVGYRDNTAVPGRTYTYSVESEAGTELSSPATIDVTVKRPSLAEARLAGSFDVNAKVVSNTGFSSIHMTNNYGFTFTPKCHQGPCPVTWTVIGLKGVKAAMQRSGPTYTVAETGDFHVKCGSSDTQTTWTLTLHVTQGKAIDGVWRALKLAGTIDESSPAQLGCVSSHATETFTASLVA